MSSHPSLSSLLKDPSLLKTSCYVNGSWTDAASGASFEVTNPSTLNTVARCPEFDVADTNAAIAAAHEALPAYRATAPRVRARHLRAWFDLVMANVDDLAHIITLENGKPLADARGEVAYSASFLEWFAEEAPRISGSLIQGAGDPARCRVVTRREPVGVCALIAPWNFPAAMITRKVGPALAAGCTVVIKAPGEAPLSALALVELARRAGIPDGVVNVVTTLEHTAAVGEALTTNPIIKKVSFTGSTGVGKLLMRQSAPTLKKLSFELGGNAPFIVFDDADVDAAVRGLITSKFRLSGQTCVCANRVLVQRGVYDRFVAKVADVVRQFRVGDGLDPKTTHGPLIHGRAAAKVKEHVDDAVAQGARVVLGGNPLPALGPNFFELTLLADMKAGMKICSEETFGPIAAFFAFDTEEEALRVANEADVGLAGYFFSRDIERCWRVAEALEVGMVGVNTGAISDPASPFGGVKESGFGREGGAVGIDEYLVCKTITMGLGQ